MYFCELVIFVFASPLVATFAFTASQARKVNDFLIKAIFLTIKPFLIVLALLGALGASWLLFRTISALAKTIIKMLSDENFGVGGGFR